MGGSTWHIDSYLPTDVVTELLLWVSPLPILTGSEVGWLTVLLMISEIILEAEFTIAELTDVLASLFRHLRAERQL
jgi:hypothetical protein